MLYCLAAAGVSKILVSEPSSTRASRALEAGADKVFNPLTEDAVALAKESSDGRGPHIVFETAAVEKSVEAAFLAVRGKGTIVEIGKFEHPISVQPNIINRKSASYVMSNIYTRGEFQEVIEAIASGG